MRLQRLRISAFGPFAEPVDLDFAALNDAGLFLLTGSNGAGKSSILDAVCFALYGAVPGERNAARRFRSDHAGPGDAPIVELEASFSSGTYRIVRTAAWERPKRRGSGTTSQQSTVSVSRRVGDVWQPVTNRLDEAGHLVTRLVGMNLTQFCQVVILPQGRFQAFLQSTATERQALLQQLFHTGRFQRVEAWLRDHRRALRRRSEEHAESVREVVSRISEVTGEPAPDVDDARPWVVVLQESLAGDLAVSDELARAAAADELSARLALESARDLAGRVARRRAGLAEQAALEARSDEVASLQQRVDAARRAAPVAVLGPLVHTRDRALAAATAAHEAATERLVAALGAAPDDLEGAAAGLREATGRLEALLPRADEADALRADLAAAADEEAALEARSAALASSDLAALLVDLTAHRDEAVAAELAVPDVRTAIDDARARLRAHEQVADLTARLDAASADLVLATTRALDAKDAWLTLREARIEGMAAELAGGLAVGADCPVCGSHDHPRPATAHADAPDAEAERLAQREVDDANAAQHLHDVQVRELTGRLELAREACGDGTPAELRDALSGLRARARDLGETAAAVPDRQAALDAALERERSEAAEAGELHERRAVLAARRADREIRLATLRDALDAELAATPYADVHEAVADTRARLGLVESALLAGRELAEANEAATETHDARAAAARDAGFASPELAEEALLPPDELADHEADLARHRARLQAVTTLLAEPTLVGLDGVEPPDVDALEAGDAAAEATRARARSDAESLRRRLARLATLADELGERHAAWSPVRDELELATRLSSFCEGKAADNRWQIQLSAYVVAWRLSQVADAANLRLAVMTHGRYSLEHSDLRSAGERRGGLTLLVRDDWTGVTRDPVTLSGGETFVVALALALGLADVITAEAGGASLQTLFVDEGFGMLDATSLDLVLDTLDGLRESGRTVGVVSHVAEMRSRIPVQVQVHKPHDHGPSTVRLRA